MDRNQKGENRLPVWGKGEDGAGSRKNRVLCSRHASRPTHRDTNPAALLSPAVSRGCHATPRANRSLYNALSLGVLTPLVLQGPAPKVPAWLLSSPTSPPVPGRPGSEKRSGGSWLPGRRLGSAASAVPAGRCGGYPDPHPPSSRAPARRTRGPASVNGRPDLRSAALSLGAARSKQGPSLAFLLRL